MWVSAAHTLCASSVLSFSSWHELNHTHVQHEEHKSQGLNRFSQWNEVWVHIKFRCIWISRSPKNNSRFDRKHVQKQANSGRHSSRSSFVVRLHTENLFIWHLLYMISAKTPHLVHGQTLNKKKKEKQWKMKKTNVSKVNAINGRCQCVCVRWWWYFCCWCFCGILVRTRSQKYCTQLTYVTAKHVFPFHVVIGFVRT